MARKIIDISVYLENDVVSDPPIYRPKIEYINHKMSVPELLGFFPGLEQKDLPDEEAWAIEKIELITHNGTHLDAPYHFASTMNGGERAMTIDEVPLDWCFQPGVKLDFRHFDDGYVVTAADVAAELDRIGHVLSPLEIVVVNTAAGKRYGRDDYVTAGCGMGYDATMYLLERGVRLTGTDGWSWDAPFVHTRQRYEETGDAGLIWEGHKAGRDIGYCHLEKLHNLEVLPATGFMISCFPVKIRGASAGWTRAVAIFDN
ncbi:cyclase family protein [Aquisediminimonas sediminicola]|uniref:cyclase family protein n=1 Tax=Alteraquisediminimonas sediminicola TaxID=2676787 RepID=UPI001C8F1C79|nr:cyclase family protein [Aquisediminimonas sediminicola]